MIDSTNLKIKNYADDEYMKEPSYDQRLNMVERNGYLIQMNSDKEIKTQQSHDSNFSEDLGYDPENSDEYMDSNPIEQDNLPDSNAINKH